jgi:hypothetical protein
MMPQDQLLLHSFAPDERLPAALPAVAAPMAGRPARKTLLTRDSLHIVERNGQAHVIAENYSYKSEAYYTILTREMSGQPVLPGTRAVLDASVVPICLERARLEGIPAAECIISQSCLSGPAVVYGLNYFACSSQFELAVDSRAKEVEKHVTNNGKYPFCYQPLPEDGRVEQHVAIFGRTFSGGEDIAALAGKVYAIFRIPLAGLIFITTDESTVLSSLCPVRYSQLSPAEKGLLRAYIAGQEFL